MHRAPKEVDLALLAKVEHEVVAWREAPVADKQTDESEQMIGRDSPSPLGQRLPGARPSSCRGVPVGAPEERVRRAKTELRSRSRRSGRRLLGQDTMVRSDEEVDAQALEADHVSAILLADESQRLLVLETSGRRTGGEALLSCHGRPGLPALGCQDVSAVVIAAVPLAHEEADQADIRLLQDVLPLGEADPGRVGDREVARHRTVEADEAVLEETDLARSRHARTLRRGSDGALSTKTTAS